MNVTDPILALADSAPDAPALFAPRGVVRRGKLADAVRKYAAWLLRRGLQPGDRVGVALRAPVQRLITSLSLAHLGIAFIGFSHLDSPLMRSRTAARLNLAALLRDPGESADAGCTVLEPDHAAIDAEQPLAARPAPVAPSAPWLILRSSGTTGEPKFALLSHAEAMARSRRFQRLWGCGPRDRFWSMVGPEFVVAVQRIHYCMHAGAAVCMAPRGLERDDPVLVKAGVTLACATPLHMERLLAVDPAPQFLRSLRVFEARSATISEPLRAAFRERCTPSLHVVYASNEAETITLATPELQLAVPETVGVAAPGVEVQVVDDAGKPLPPGETGEVRVRGEGVIREYLDNAQDTARSFRDGWFHPGDLARFSPQGALVLQGRSDDMMISAGVNIYPAEIERALLQHPAVADAAAFPVASRRMQDAPVAAVVLRSPVVPAALLAFCRERLGASTPVAVFTVGAFPRNAGGKVMKRELARMAQADERLRKILP